MTGTEMRPATKKPHVSGGVEWTGEHVAIGPRGMRWGMEARCVVMDHDVVLFVRSTTMDRYVVVDLVDAAGMIFARQAQAFSASATDPKVGEGRRLAAERDEAIGWAHKAMLSSYIGKPPPIMRGDAERMVDALIAHGWGPLPAEPEPVDWDDWPDGE